MASAPLVRYRDDERSIVAAANTTAPPVNSTSQSMFYEKFRRAYEAPAGLPWQGPVVRRLLELDQLPEGWDGYGGVPLRTDVPMFALRVLSSIMRPRTPIPQIVPTGSGGLQLEWHEKDIDLEIYISEPYACELWFKDHRGEAAPVSIEFDSDFSALSEPIAILSKR